MVNLQEPVILSNLERRRVDMGKFTYRDVIMNPRDSRVKRKKRYWAANNPKDCIDKANNNERTCKLTAVIRGNFAPFFVKHLLKTENVTYLIKKSKNKKKREEN